MPRTSKQHQSNSERRETGSSISTLSLSTATISHFYISLILYSLIFSYIFHLSFKCPAFSFALPLSPFSDLAQGNQTGLGNPAHISQVQDVQSPSRRSQPPRQHERLLHAPRLTNWTLESNPTTDRMLYVRAASRVDVGRPVDVPRFHGKSTILTTRVLS